MLITLLLACATDDSGEAPPPYGMILENDGQLYAGVSQVEITPEIQETFQDLNGNHQFDGCLTDPSGTRGGCEEPFDDADGNGHFDPYWIAGYQSNRPANGVHDPLTVTAVVFSLDGEYVALVGVDAIGILENRIRDVKDLVEADGFDRDRLIVSSSHVHSGPDTVGIWGPDEVTTGADPAYLESIVAAIQETVATASSTMEAVSPKVGVAHLDTPEFSGEPFGGINPDASVLEGLNDIRDPIVVGGQILTIELDGANGRLATIVNASGHPEVSDSDHNELSADYPGAIRDWVGSVDGGTTMFLSGALGGMQSAGGATLPYIDEAGNRLYNEDGSPVWYDTGGFEFVRVFGTEVAQAGLASATDAQPWDAISVRHADYLVPVDNISFKLAFQLHLLDTPNEYVVRDSSCPGYGKDIDVFGCVPVSSNVVRLGPVTFGSVPGELFPELFWGVPDEPAMVDPSLRSTDRRWVQYDPDCGSIDWDTECKSSESIGVASDCDGDGPLCDGTCDCLHSHAAPYRVSDTLPTPVMDLLPGTYKAPLGITNGYCGYIVPGPDFNTFVNVTTENGDHYEETNSCSASFADVVLASFGELAE